MANATNEKGHLFRALAYAVLDPAIDDPHLRSTIYQRITPTVLRRAAAEAERMVRPLDDHYVDFFETRYGYLRQFTPAFLEAFPFLSHHSPEPLVEAVERLQQLHSTHRRIVPKEAPTDFVTIKWRPDGVNPNGQLDRPYYELWTLWELRGALRAGNVWVSSRRRYANPETYLIPKAQWPSLRPAICQELRTPENGAARLEERGRELHALLPQVNRLMAGQR